MKRADVASALFWLGVAVYVGYAGWDLGLGKVRDPGAGFTVFWVSVIMAALALVVMAAALRLPGGGFAQRWTGVRWGKVLAVLAALVVFGWALPRLGFLLTTTLVMLFLFKAVEPQRWPVAVAGAVASAAIAYVLFKVWLGAQLPAGVLGLG